MKKMQINTLSSSLVISLDQTLPHFSSRFDCILSFNFSLNLCNITPVLSLEQRWPSGSVILMTSTSPFASRVEMLKGHLNHLQSAHLHFTSSGHSFCLWQIWIPFTISHFVPSWVESTSSTTQVRDQVFLSGFFILHLRATLYIVHSLLLKIDHLILKGCYYLVDR